MARGIQIGTTASSPESIKLDGAVRIISETLMRRACFDGWGMGEKPQRTGYSWRSGIDKHILLQHRIEEGCQPDGGILFDKNDIPVLAIEAKKQGEKGNAIERQIKNYSVLRYFNPKVCMVTFAIGKGCAPGKPIYNHALSRFPIEEMDFERMNIPPIKFKELNVLYPMGVSWFLSIGGFTQTDITTVISNALIMIKT